MKILKSYNVNAIKRYIRHWYQNITENMNNLIKNAPKINRPKSKHSGSNPRNDVSPAKHSYASLPRKYDYQTDRQTNRQTDRQTPGKLSLCAAVLRWRHKILLWIFI